MKKIFILVMFTLSALCVKAQTNITGNLSDGDGGLPSANVQILKLPDTTKYITGAVTDADGNFTIKNVQQGNYMVKISYIGYQNYTKKININSATKEFKLGDIVLKSGVVLSGAKVVAHAAAVSIKGDTVEYNPESYKLQQNAVVEDLLKKLPGVQVDKDGTVTAGGKEVKKVLIGGKEFFANDPTIATKNIPVNAIKRVQVHEQKSEQEQLTGISDGEEEMVINLDFKPGQQQGWMGNLGAGIGRDIKNASGNKTRTDENLMLNRFTSSSRYTLIGNYNNINSGRGGRNTFGGTAGNTDAGMLGLDLATYATEKLTVESSGMFSYSHTNVENTSTRETFLQDSSFYKNSAALNDTYSRNYQFDARITYKPNKYNTLVFRPTVNHTHTDRQSNSSSETLDGDHNAVNKNEQNNTSESKNTSYGAEVDYAHAFGDNGRKLSFGAEVNRSTTDGNSSTYSKTEYLLFGKDSILDQRTNSNSDNTAYRFRASYVEPLSKHVFLQASYSFRTSLQNSDKYTYSKDASGNYSILDSAYSNSYRNRYTNQRIQLSLRIDQNKYSFQIGFNVTPQSSTSTRYIAGVQQNSQTRKVTNIGPMARFQYNFTKSHNLRVDYRTESGQPSLSQLDPLRDVSNPLNVRYGNPNLKPSYSHQINVRYNLNNRAKMSTLMVRIRSSIEQNSIVSKSFYNTDGTQETTYDNVNGVWNFNAYVTANYPLNAFWQLNTSSSARMAQSVSLNNNIKSKTRSDKFSPNLGLQYSNSFMDLGAGGTIGFTNTRNSIDKTKDQSIRDYDINAWTTIYLPLNLSLSSDISYKNGSGYAAGYNVRQTVWNAGLQLGILKNQGTVKFSVNDILRQKKNITYSVTDNYIQQAINNTLNCYFMITFTYRFNIFGGKAVSGTGGNQQMGPAGLGGGFGGKRRF